MLELGNSPTHSLFIFAYGNQMPNCNDKKIIQCCAIHYSFIFNHISIDREWGMNSSISSFIHLRPILKELNPLLIKFYWIACSSGRFRLELPHYTQVGVEYTTAVKGLTSCLDTGRTGRAVCSVRRYDPCNDVLASAGKDKIIKLLFVVSAFFTIINHIRFSSKQSPVV